MRILFSSLLLCYCNSVLKGFSNTIIIVINRNKSNYCTIKDGLFCSVTTIIMADKTGFLDEPVLDKLGLIYGDSQATKVIARLASITSRERTTYGIHNINECPMTYTIILLLKFQYFRLT